jgi:hypothetical protein
VAETALTMVQRYYPKVKNVVDAKKPLELEVNKSDCTSAQPKSFTNCAAARACKRHGHDGAIITLSSAYVIDGDKAVRYKVSAVLSREIVVLDRTKDGDRLHAQTFRLGAPTASGRLGPRRYAERRPKGKRHNPTGRRAKPVYTENVRNIRGDDVKLDKNTTTPPKRK